MFDKELINLLNKYSASRIFNIDLNAPVNNRKNNICSWFIINQNPESEDPEVILEREARPAEDPAKSNLSIETEKLNIINNSYFLINNNFFYEYKIYC